MLSTPPHALKPLRGGVDDVFISHPCNMTSCISCLITTFEKELRDDASIIVLNVEKMITERLDAHTSNILILIDSRIH